MSPSREDENGGRITDVPGEQIIYIKSLRKRACTDREASHEAGSPDKSNVSRTAVIMMDQFWKPDNITGPHPCPDVDVIGTSVCVVSIIMATRL